MIRNILSTIAAAALAAPAAFGGYEALTFAAGRHPAPFGKAVRVEATSTNAAGTATVSIVREIPVPGVRAEVSLSTNWVATAISTNAVVDWRGTNWTYAVSASNAVVSATTNLVPYTAAVLATTNALATIQCAGGWGAEDIEGGEWLGGDILVEGAAGGSCTVIFVR